MLKIFKKESLEDTRKRIRSGIKSDNYTRLIQCIIMDGFNGYKRDFNVYKVNEHGRRNRCS